MKILLKVYCVIVMSIILAATTINKNSLDNIRMNFLHSFAKDIRAKHKKGEPTKQIYQFYWTESFFRQLWQRLGLSEADYSDMFHW